ncbi:MAG: Lrp/AsnC family transcriptional regulator [Rhodospirillales bacterium]|nr:Lrp/AsnC family transcriptional regulator [Rhodospirillales bacterium]MBO6785558.1 Lrp/AsnC family transcriptional regulator [Rhodospirillales bacterium]
MTEIERRIVNRYQRGFPYEPRPFKAMADALGLTEELVLNTLADLRERRILSRVGAVIAPNTVGASTLAAMSVPQAMLDQVAAQVSAHPEVNHNYEREHHLNLWFVLAADDRDAVLEVIRKIEAETGLEVVELPLEESYHIDLGFRV